MMARWLRLLAVAALVVALGLAAAYAARRFGPAGDGTVQVTGTIEARQVDVSAKIAGRISSLLVNAGQAVTKGEIIALLDFTDLEAEARRAEAALRTAEAQLKDLEAGARVYEINEARAQVARAEARLDDLLAGSRVQEVEQAREAMRSAAASRDWAEREYRRAQELYAKELVAAQEVDRAKQAWEVAVANQGSAREKLSLVEAGSRVQEIAAARAELKAAQERLELLMAGPRPDAVAGARARVAEARAALALAESRLREGKIVSPLTGVVLRKNLEAGEMANPGVPIVTLVDPSDMWVRAYVPEAEVGRIRLGEPAQVTVDAFPGRAFPGKITEIASEAEFTPKNVQTRKERVNLVFRIKIGLSNFEGTLKPGMPADAVLGAGAQT
ncbi:MAG: hemolysin secretion protein D [Candidatus Rokuibacteriota bacterium]|nr:MAG: hemolysin secretion protein D [Candidatus Rokubacteria bacterium]